MHRGEGTTSGVRGGRRSKVTATTRGLCISATLQSNANVRRAVNAVAGAGAFNEGGSSCAWMPASTSGGYSASALVVEIRSYDAKQYDRYEHPTPTAEGDVDS